MAGFLLALAGGAAEGWGEGQLQAIKATREEKLRQLELDRAERIESNRQGFEASENALTRSAQERQTNAQIAATERNTNAQLGVTRELGLANIDVDRERIASGETLTREQIKAQVDTSLAELNSREGIAAADRAAAAPVVTTREGATGVLESGIFKPTVDAAGKPVNIITADNENSADAKTMQYLINLGTPVDEAKRLVLENKNSDPSVIGASIFNNIMDVSRKNMGNPTAEDITNQVKAAVGHTRRAMGELGLNPDEFDPATVGGTDGTPATAVEPAATTPDATKPEPTAQLTPAQKQKVIDDAIIAIKPKAEGGLGKPKAAVRAALPKGVLPSEVPGL